MAGSGVTTHFRCCGRPKIAPFAGTRTLDGKQYLYCRPCRNARQNRYRKANREKVNSWVVRGRLRKQGITVLPLIRIPRADEVALAGMRADILAAIEDAVPEEVETVIREMLKGAYMLGEERRRLQREEEAA